MSREVSEYMARIGKKGGKAKGYKRADMQPGGNTYQKIHGKRNAEPAIENKTEVAPPPNDDVEVYVGGVLQD